MYYISIYYIHVNMQYTYLHHIIHLLLKLLLLFDISYIYNIYHVMSGKNAHTGAAFGAIKGHIKIIK